MEIEKQSLEESVATQRNFPLAICDAEHLFLYHKCNKTFLFRPKGGEVYVFGPENPSEINDRVSDGHVLSWEGTRKIKGRIGTMTKNTFISLSNQKERKGSLLTRGSGRKSTLHRKSPREELL